MGRLRTWQWNWQSLQLYRATRARFLLSIEGFRGGLEQAVVVIDKRAGHDVELTRYEWGSAHAILRILFNTVDTDSILEIRKPTNPGSGTARFFQ
jgi:hypothetical protein